jgi:hypothetical protein
MPDDLRAKLTAIAARVAASDGDPQASAEAVQTTYAQAQGDDALELGFSSEAPPGDSTVWVIELHGTFACEMCSRPPGAEVQRGDTIVLVVYPPKIEPRDFGIGNHFGDLTGLGEVVQLTP